YSPSLVSPSEIPSDQYALEFGAWKVKEESKIGQCKRPEKPIEIYEFEGCPFCRKRDGNSLGPRCIILPLSSKGPTFRPKVLEMGGKKQFPYMVDPNTGVAMYESDDIIKYLADTYGASLDLCVKRIVSFYPLPRPHFWHWVCPLKVSSYNDLTDLTHLCLFFLGDGTVPIMLSLGLLTAITAGLATLGRIGKGNSYIASKVPPQPIEIWACEGSPFCKLVRETLVELELPHLLHSCARGSPKRQEFFKKKGLFQ
ncbi:hypothetical protein ACJX0J_008634, partial [Zea mays]